MTTVHVYWIPATWKGRLGIVPRPRGDDWLADDIDAWRRADIDVAVSLLEPDEAADLGLENEPAVAAANGIDFRVFPIPDCGVPNSRESVAKVMNDLIGALMLGRNVVVHCRQGIGRSGLIVSGVLVAAGEDPNRALETVSRARGRAVPETDEQHQWLRMFATWLASTNVQPGTVNATW